MCNEYDPLVIGKNIKRKRQEMDYSQSDLSEIIDMEKSEICKYEHGKIKGMRVDTLFRFCNALKTNVNEIVYDSNNSEVNGSGVLYINSDIEFKQLMKAFRIVEEQDNEKYKK